MRIKYFRAPDVKERVNEIADKLDFFNVVPQFVYCVRSKGSKSERSVARIHGLGRIWQEALNLPPYYIIEVISERFDKLSEAEKDKTLIHELLHIPSVFSGGFRPHKGYVEREIVEKLHKQLERNRISKNTIFKLDGDGEGF